MRNWLPLLLASAAFAQAPPTLDCGRSVDGNLDVFSTTYYNTPGAAAGDAMMVRLLVTDPALKPKLSLTVTDQVGRPVAARSNLNTEVGKGASLVGEYDLRIDGPYQLRVQNTGQTAVPYRLVYTWLNKPCSGPGLVCGVSTTGQLSAALELQTYQFTAQKDDLLSARMARIGTAPKGFDAAMFVYSAAGQLASTITGSPALADTVKTGLARLDFRAPSDGPITILVYDPAGLAGSYALALVRLGGPSGACSTSSLGCGTVSQGKIGGPLNVNTYSAKLNAGDQVSLRIAADGSGPFSPQAEVYDPQGNVVAVNRGRLPVSGRAVTTESFTAAAGGVFIVAVQDVATALNTGGYAISMLLLNRPCDKVVTLSCGSTTDGSLSGVLATNIYTLAANANDKFLVRLLNTATGGLFSARLEIFDAQGNILQTVTTSDLARQTFTIPSTGTYTVVASDGYDASETGSYTLWLMRLNGPCGASAGTLSCGMLTPGSFGRPLDTPVYTYRAGGPFTLRMIDNTGSLQESLEVYDAQGNPAGQNIGGAFAGVDVAAAAGGVYTVLAMDGSKRPAGGPFAIELLGTAGGCETPVPQGQTVSGVVSAGRPFLSYSIPANAGDALAVRSTSLTAGFSALMDLYDPAGARLDSQTFGISRRAAAGGTYTLIVGGVAPRTAGGYALSWQLLNSPAGTTPLACGGSAVASLTASNQFRYYTASAGAGDLMRLIFTRLSDNFSPQVELYDASGARMAASPDIAQKAPADGDYLVMVGPSTSNGETGTYSLAYQRANRPCSAAGLTCGQTTLRTVSLPAQLDAFTFDGTGGDQANVKMTQRTGAYVPVVELYDGNGTRLGTSASGQMRQLLPASGTYALLVRDLNATNTGSYRVSLQNDTKACMVSDTESPVVSLVRPTGGEAIGGGTSYRVAWQSDDNVGVASHEVALSTDGGQTFGATIAAGLSGNAQSFDWPVPPDIAPSRDAVIRVTAKDAAGNAQAAESGPLAIIGSGFQPNMTAAYTYDVLNRLTQAVMGDGRTIQYTWDAVGNLVEITVSGQ